MRNPRQLRWQDPTTYEDGSPFGVADFLAYELGVSSQPGVPPTVALLALPVSLGIGESPIPDAVREARGKQYLRLRTVDVSEVASEWSNEVEVQFTGRPLPPSSVTPS